MFKWWRMNKARVELAPAAAPAPERPARSDPEWPAILGVPFRREDGVVLSTEPVCDVEIQGVPCRKGATVSFHDNGQLKTARLAHRLTLDADDLPTGALVAFQRDGATMSWSAVLDDARTFWVRPASSESLDCRVDIPAGARVDKDYGRLRAFDAPGPVTVDGITFPAHTEVTFGDSGALSHARPLEELEVRGVLCLENETIVFEFGFLRQAYAAGACTIHGVPCTAYDIVRLHDSGRVARCSLSEDVEIEGVGCRGNTRVLLSDSGRVLEATLSRAHDFGGIAVEAGAVVTFHESGQLMYTTLTRPHDFRGVSAPAGSRVWLRESGVPSLIARALDDGTGALYLDEEGAVRRRLPVTRRGASPISAMLREPVRIDGYACRKGSVEFHESGALSQFVLDGDQVVGGLAAKSSTRVRLREDGSAIEVTLTDDTEIKGIVCLGARTLSMSGGGAESYAEYARMHRTGFVEFAQLARNTKIGGVPARGYESVCLHEDGRLKLVTLARDWKHADGWTAKAGTLLMLRDDGQPQAVTLAKPANISGLAFAAGAELQFGDDGAPKQVGAVSVSILPVRRLAD